ncbi:hypothetical protein PTTG_05759 [Puccinia triticina 1-1 BBBD Race 1]|uniref:DDHD domain-containing protein n=2 Tax=Puccinia triticina TaxID=208348 RepID=A0A180GX84_PUCT1|nr:uncharacterized protein PtA15_6A767 [Puccinia triticina]OAV97131.1 hypothetical protein PTTG_05759 [Puccinia triticina 1-1 BBBD Race 1]WAQ86137.1 hypothetical protein PtA15_6A767 [Puccinia triticina]WAR56023.1 hypothetical protein PtB15_6B767 [Puccinia triticina]
MANSTSKPPLVSHFLHTGPALSDFNSLGSLISNPTTSSSASSTNPTSNPSQSTTAGGSTTTTTASSTTTTTSTATRVVAGGSLPTPVACSPFSKKENEKIELAWRILHAPRNSNSSSEKTTIRRSSGSTDQISNSHPSHRSQQSTADSQGAHLEFNPKGKAKLVSETTGNTDNEDDTSSFQLPDSQAVDSDEFDNEDAVLNLSMDDHPSIVPVGLDSLFTVDVRRLKLYPAFWHGPHLDVYKGKWFYPTTSKHKFYPCDPDLAEALEAAYDQIRPWDLSYEDELRSALKIGTEAEDKLKVHLKEFDHDVIFETATQGRVYSRAVSSRISKTILTNFFTSISKKTAGYSGGTVVIRGWDQVQSWSGLESEDALADQKQPSSENLDQAGIGGASGLNTTADMIQEEDLENPNAEVSELVLVIHGIGQKLAQSYDSFDFVHACNQLRVECHKASTTDQKMKNFLQNRRVQFIPIRWRHSLDFEMEGFTDQEDVSSENETEEGRRIKNTFAMKDIQIPDSIPFVREVVTSLVLDVPLYMSPKQHKLMIAAVIEQANKVYRLFCRRNTYYTGRKVSILAHSLGAALSVDILSRQPSAWTMDVEMSEVMGDTQAYLSALNHFCFDTSKVFLVGSPVAFFFHLHRAQLIAREGVSKSTSLDFKNSPEWRKANRVASDEVGQYGCLAAETIYSVYISTDPVAYCMNACVDCRHSKRIKPIDARSFTKKFLETMRRKRPATDHDAVLTRNVSLSSLSSLVANSWMGSTKKCEPHDLIKNINTQATLQNMTAAKPCSQPASIPVPPLPTSMVGGWTDLVRKRTRVFTSSRENIREEPLKKTKQGENILGRMRFLALNPTGSVDFVIPSLGLNQYVDMVTAHAAYWTDIRFARLVLIGLFGEDSVLEEVGDLENPSNPA